VSSGQLFPRIFGTPDPDEGLVRAAQRGDAAAFDRLVRRHEGALLGFLNARLLSEEAAREVAQECLLGAWKQIGRFNGRSRFKTWLFGIASHKATDYLRRCAALPRTLALQDAEAQLQASEATWSADPQRLVDRAESELRIRDAVAHLPEVQRRALELYYYGGLNLREIASLMELNLSTLKYQFYQAHRALRPLVADLLELLPPAAGQAQRGSERRVTAHEL
jgi:RNA polymerase sigma-70 factor (ECF subfamily)